MANDGNDDRELLARFLEHREQAAFEAVVRRHESMVVNVCTRILGNAQDARDAAQAVFLALALQAHRLDLSKPLGPWLHRVASCTALKALRARQSRRAWEQAAMERKLHESGRDRAWESLKPVLDDELDGLPDRYRRPLVLFHLEGKTLEETAVELRSNVGTVGAWLSRGRDLLRDRLVRRGVTGVSVGLLGALLSSEAAARASETGFATWTAKAAASGLISAPVATLLKGAMNMVIVAKLKAVGAMALVAGALVLAQALVPSGEAAPASVILSGAEPRAAALDAAVLLATESFSAEPEQADAAPARSSDLVAHWKLDDDKSATGVSDSSGRNHKGRFVGSPAWTGGKLGGALKFDGKSHVEIANSDDLNKVQEGSYTIAAWFNPENAPPGTENANDANYGIVLKTGWHLGLSYSNEQKFIMTHWLVGEKPEEPIWKGAGTWEETYAPGQWWHAVGVVDRAGGKVQIFVNGELKNESEFDANAKARDYEVQSWKIGIGCPNVEQWSWPCKGMIDDVRIYNRALSGMDVKALFEGTLK